MIIYATILRSCHYYRHYMQIDKLAWEKEIMSAIKSLRSAAACLVGLGQESQSWEKDLKAISRGEKGELLRNNDVMRSVKIWRPQARVTRTQREAGGEEGKPRWRGKAPSCLCCSPPAHTAHRQNFAVCNVLHQLHFQQLSCPAVARHVTWSLHKLNCIAS